MNKVKAKIVVVGNSAVGKSTLLQLYANGVYQKDYIMTQAAEVYSKVIPFPAEEKDVELFLFDISGHDLHKSIAEELVKDASGFMILFDCTNQESFNSVQKWLDFVKKANGKAVKGVLVSTKNDLKNLKSVEMGEGLEFAKKLGLEYFETSSARNMDIEAPFMKLAEAVVKSTILKNSLYIN